MAPQLNIPANEPAGDRGQSVSVELQREIEQFLYHEARLLDDRRFEEWYALLADDLHYVMPTRYNRLRREAEHEYAAADEAQHFDEDKHSIAQRIRRLRSGTAWAEDPPSRTRHFVSNVVVRRGAGPEEFEVDCYYLLYRSRLEREVEMFAGMRHDLVRRSAGHGWQIARRRIILDQTVVLARNLSFFF